ncbi:envelope integrity protein Cei [Rhodococcus sp. NPDC056743]|uniref:envelope integrity protein Cei n=1 Tax=Rhodococcus sp. NPDC056743 TaxID=3345934 RepID=UPI00366F52BC
MVSLITEGSATDDQGRPFRRRRVWPVVAVFAVLAVLGSALWIKILTADAKISDTVACNRPQASSDPAAPQPMPLGSVVDRTTLLDVEPAPLAATKVRVFNANGESGQASQVAAQLKDYGFASAPDVQVGNDPVYVDQNMQCQGQIRFGENGIAAASAVWLVAPCAELIEDGRTDDTVDLALGTYFGKISPNTDAGEVLRALAEQPANAEAAAMDIDLLKAARTARC